MSESITRQVIEDWVRQTTGTFDYQMMFREIPINDPDNRQNAYVYMGRICKDRIAKAINGRHGTFRLIDRDAPILNWKGVNDFEGLDIHWPFKLEEFVRIFPRNLIVVGGDPNEGKTAFLHNVIDLNWRKYPIVLFDSENSEKELALRFAHYSDYKLWPDDLVRERSQNFSDVIEPDSVNIIDYLEITDNFYNVAKLLREIRDALNKGIAIVAIQKAKGAELPIGRDFSRQIARLVLTIDPGVLTIRKAKSFAQRTVNPNNMKFTFKLKDGAYFTDIQESWMT
ncbi:hypothetical protein LCGC14_0384780 [marine sediment metagenome]|uniref:Uncharacterized protein n=1 Tax=marine sediment metagenome TaxID=412755 RepID=A0A0F9VNB8_9ZZZZ